MEVAQLREKYVREAVRKKGALLTDAQREAAGLKPFVPAYAREEALKDLAVWDLGQLERALVVQSRSYDPEEQVISFMVLTKGKWTPPQRTADQSHWNAGEVKVVFYDKNEEKVHPALDGSKWYRGVTRAEAKLSDRELEEGLQRWRIKIDLGGNLASLKGAATAKFFYPEPK